MIVPFRLIPCRATNKHSRIHCRRQCNHSKGNSKQCKLVDCTSDVGENILKYESGGCTCYALVHSRSPVQPNPRFENFHNLALFSHITWMPPYLFVIAVSRACTQTIEFLAPRMHIYIILYNFKQSSYHCIIHIILDTQKSWTLRLQAVKLLRCKHLLRSRSNLCKEAAMQKPWYTPTVNIMRQRIKWFWDRDLHQWVI